ncbi:uncharacterized protein LOC108029417 isoform X2 [Drosophila biarmipes]|uniref:uncharacterized protein LOC108029417 isoform X2 n=1 Tax=Drosophila biarmipes TaxID=125945 RepID=UPI0007E6E79E|nr:uncharacterized protein LOC108029417 isoform X2 [Drosophila biarmipes]
MCLRRHQKRFCLILALVTITWGLAEVIYGYHILTTKGVNNWLMAAIVAWIPVLIASIFLILGALKKIPRLLLVWIIVSLICGIALIIIKSGLLIYLHDCSATNDILTALLNIIFLLLVYVWAFYPYAYMREMKEQLLE